MHRPPRCGRLLHEIDRVRIERRKRFPHLCRHVQAQALNLTQRGLPPIRVSAVWGNGLRVDIWEPFKERFGIKTVYELYTATEAPTGMFNASTNSFSAGAFGRSGTLALLLVGRQMAVVRMDDSTTSPLIPPSLALAHASQHAHA